MGRSILIQYAHPYPIRSRVNGQLLAAVRDLDGVTVNDLYERYPEVHIDVAREQALLRETSLLIFMHPMYWYSSPSILKEWQDSVLEAGFAYGRGGTALHGKDFLTVTTTGAEEKTYQETADGDCDIDTLLTPFTQTARFCGMQWLTPFVVCGTNTISDNEIVSAAARLREQLKRYLAGAN